MLKGHPTPFLVTVLLLAGLMVVSADAQAQAPEGEASPPAATGTIELTVKFDGIVPPRAVVDAGEFKHHCGKAKSILTEDMVIGGDGALANVAAILEHPPVTPASPQTATLDQKNCSFVPHVQTATVGATLDIGNDDGILHNVHGTLRKRDVFNLAMPVPKVRVKRPLPSTGVVSIRCDSGHTWMSAYIIVVAHPYHGTTDERGKVQLTGVPEGEWVLRTWHERLGMKKINVTVQAGGVASLDVTYSPAEHSDEEAPVRDIEVEKLNDELSSLKTAYQAAVGELRTEVMQEFRADRRARSLKEGRSLYLRHCAACHGEAGDGQGPAARFLDIMPRDFTRQVFKLRTTPTGSPPSVNDVYRTISLGMPGTEMPPWRNILTNEERLTLARYVLAIGEDLSSEVVSSEPVVIGAETPNDAESVARGKELYTQFGCFACHGTEGRGDGPAASAMQDAWGNKIQPADFTRGYYKGGVGAKVVYRTLVTGLSGTPMPSFGAALQPEQIWDLAHYVESLKEDGGVTGYLFTDPAGRKTVP